MGYVADVLCRLCVGMSLAGDAGVACMDAWFAEFEAAAKGAGLAWVSPWVDAYDGELALVWSRNGRRLIAELVRRDDGTCFVTDGRSDRAPLSVDAAVAAWRQMTCGG